MPDPRRRDGQDQRGVLVRARPRRSRPSRRSPGEPVNYYVIIDFTGFQKLVDEVGGVYIDVDRRYYNKQDGTAAHNYDEIDLQPGYQKLNGADALDFVRYRHTDSDYARIARQQMFLSELKRQTKQLGNLTKPTALRKIFAENIETNLTNVPKFLSHPGARAHGAEGPDRAGLDPGLGRHDQRRVGRGGLPSRRSTRRSPSGRSPSSSRATPAHGQAGRPGHGGRDGAQRQRPRARSRGRRRRPSTPSATPRRWAATPTTSTTPPARSTTPRRSASRRARSPSCSGRRPRSARSSRRRGARQRGGGGHRRGLDRQARHAAQARDGGRRPTTVDTTSLVDTMRAIRSQVPGAEGDGADEGRRAAPRVKIVRAYKIDDKRQTARRSRSSSRPTSAARRSTGASR